MLDRYVGLACPSSQTGADMPTAREARVKCNGAINQGYHGADVLAKIGQRVSGIRKSARIVLRHLQRRPRKIGGFAAVLCGVRA